MLNNFTIFLRKNKILRFFTLLVFCITILDIKSKIILDSPNLIISFFTTSIVIIIAVYLIFLYFEIVYEYTSLSNYGKDIPFISFFKLALISTLIVLLITILISTIFALLFGNSNYILKIILQFPFSLIDLFAFLILNSILGSRSFSNLKIKIMIYFSKPSLLTYTLLLYLFLTISEIVNNLENLDNNYTFLVSTFNNLNPILFFTFNIIIIRKWQKLYFKMEIDISK
jgi:hypothetical protein